MGDDFTDEQRAVVRTSWAAALEARKKHAEALQASWASIKTPDDVPPMDPGAVDSFAELFYAILFERSPDLRCIIVSVTTAGKRLIPIVHSAVAHTANKTGAQELGEMMKGMVEEHKAYGVKEDHYPVFAAALIDAVAAAAGAEAFTADTQAAWGAFTGAATDACLKGATPEETAAKLTDDQRALVRSSWDTALTARKEYVTRLRDSWKSIEMPADVPPLDPVATDSLAELFYATLFERVPELSGIIKSVTTAGKRLLPMVHTAIAHTERRTGADELGALLKGLVQEHSQYGVREEHYQVFGEVLADSVAAAAGDAFTAESKGAWKAFTGRACTVALQQG